MGHKHQSQNAESYVKYLVNNFILMRLMRNCVLHFPVEYMVTFDLMLTTHAQIRVDIKQNLKNESNRLLGKIKTPFKTGK